MAAHVAVGEIDVAACVLVTLGSGDGVADAVGKGVGVVVGDENATDTAVVGSAVGFTILLGNNPRLFAPINKTSTSKAISPAQVNIGNCRTRPQAATIS